MHNIIRSNFLCASVVGPSGTDAFGARSRQELVRDEVAFAPGVDPHRGLLLMIERVSAQRAQMNTREDEGQNERQLLPAD